MEMESYKPSDQDVVDRLKALPFLEQDRELKKAAREMGVTVASLRKAVADACIQGDEKQDLVETPEAWPDAVDGAALAEDIRDTFLTHVIFASEHDATSATLWSLGTYLMDTWRLWPRVQITSPAKACGKSTLLEVFEAVTYRPFPGSGATGSVLFRSIEMLAPTLLLDEADTWMRQSDELAGILNSGHTRRQAYVLRTGSKENNFEPERFSTWCPIVFAGIGGQRDTLESRSIKIRLMRKLPSEKIQRLTVDFFEDNYPLRRRALRWAKDNAIKIGASETRPPETGDDRRNDNFTPLFRIAEALEGPWPERIMTAYIIAAGDDHEDQKEQVAPMLLRDLLQIAKEEKLDKVGRTFALNRLRDFGDSPWPEYRDGRPMIANDMTKLLKSFGVYSRNIKFKGKVVQGYHLEQLQDAQERFLSTKPPEKSATSPLANENRGLQVAKAISEVSENTEAATDRSLKNNESGKVASFQPATPDNAPKRDIPDDLDAMF